MADWMSAAPHRGVGVQWSWIKESRRSFMAGFLIGSGFEAVTAFFLFWAFVHGHCSCGDGVAATTVYEVPPTEEACGISVSVLPLPVLRSPDADFWAAPSHTLQTSWPHSSTPAPFPPPYPPYGRETSAYPVCSLELAGFGSWSSFTSCRRS